MRRCNWLDIPQLNPHIPLSRYRFLAVNQSRPKRLLSFPTRDMAYQPESARFQALFEPALQAYEKTTGVSLAQHPLAIILQSCDSVEAITSVLQHQAREFEDLQGSDKIMKSLKRTVSISSTLVRQQELVAYFTLLTVFLDTSTSESDTSLSRYPTRCTCHAPVHMKMAC